MNITWKKYFFGIKSPKNIVIVTICFLVLESCASHKVISRKELKELPNHFTANCLFTPERSKQNTCSPSNFINDFNDKDSFVTSNKVEIKLIDNNLFIKYKTSLDREIVLNFEGIKHKRKFEFYKKYDTITIPFVCMVKQMEKYIMYLNTNDEIVFVKKVDKNGFLLFMAAGSSYEEIYKFKYVANE